MTKITISDVARLANVSTSSVSNVLNGRTQRMRPDTMARIQHAIKQLGYTPNLAARQLKTGHSPFIGLIVPSVADPFFGFFARLVEDAALSNGYQVLLGNSDRDTERERRYAEVLWGSGIRGIIFASSLAKFTHLEGFINNGMHFITFYRSKQSDNRFVFDSIGVDNVQATRLITKHLLSLGHRRIGFISGPIDPVSRMDRLKGYHESLQEANIDKDEQLIWGEGVTDNYGAVELGRQGAHYLLSLSDPPSAIIAINDMHAFGVYAGVRDLGMNVSDDISVTGIDDIALTGVVDPPLTTIQQPIGDIARLTVEHLIGRLEDDISPTPVHLTLSPKLIVRASTARYLKKVTV
jgi:DNA-binding LacI/PurR family transcriptional regulator